MAAMPPVFVTHYKGNRERRDYIAAQFAGYKLAEPDFITDFDREEFSVDDVYRYDERQYRKMVAPIRDTLMAYAIGLLQLPTATWAQCLDAQKQLGFSLDQDFERCPWLRPRALNAAEVSVFLKHRSAWNKVATGTAPHAIIAEDDIIFMEHSVGYLQTLLDRLPNDFDYIDLAGGCGLLPRAGNKAVNDVFYEIDPPRDRTACCALMSRSFAQRLLAAQLPICLPLDWTLTLGFHVIKAKVFWAEPPVFGHGSEMNVYPSSTLQAG